MTAIKTKLRDEYHPHATEQGVPGNAYKVPARGQPVIISLDKIAGLAKEPRIGANDPRCDELVAFDMNHADTGVYIIERKSANLVESKIQKQLQAGLEFVERFVDHHGELRDRKFDYCPVLVSKRRPPKELAKIVSGWLGTSKVILHISRGEKLPAF